MGGLVSKACLFLHAAADPMYITGDPVPMYLESEGKAKCLRGSSKNESVNLVLDRQFAGRSTLGYKMADAMLLDKVFRHNTTKNIEYLGWPKSMQGVADPDLLLQINKVAREVSNKKG